MEHGSSSSLLLARCPPYVSRRPWPLARSATPQVLRPALLIATGRLRTEERYLPGFQLGRFDLEPTSLLEPPPWDDLDVDHRLAPDQLSVIRLARTGLPGLWIAVRK